MVPDSLLALAEDVLAYYQRTGQMISLTETSLGGLGMAILTTIPGASKVVEKCFVPYANEAKVEDLNIEVDLLMLHGAVSEEVVKALAEHTCQRCQLASIAFAETGIYGPGGGTPEKPVGLVYLAKAQKGAPTEVRQFQFKGDRRSIRVQTAAALLNWMLTP